MKARINGPGANGSHLSNAYLTSTQGDNEVDNGSVRREIDNKNAGKRVS
jgi:hypothetical protein